jgi:hypothetical protein
VVEGRHALNLPSPPDNACGLDQLHHTAVDRRRAQPR